MVKTILGLLVVAVSAGIAVWKWYHSAGQVAKRDSRDRGKAHKANAAKDGKRLGEWFRKRWKK